MKLAIYRPLTLVLSMYPTCSKEINTLLMASMAPLDCQSKSLNLLTAKFSQNFPEAPPTASCKVAQVKINSPRPLFLFNNTFKSKNQLLLPPFYGCVNHMFHVYYNNIWMLSFIIVQVFFFICLFKNCLLYFFMHIIKIMEMPLSHICPLLICWFPLCFLFALTLIWKNSRNS